MKKLIALLLVLTMAAALVACGETTTTTPETTEGVADTTEGVVDATEGTGEDTLPPVETPEANEATTVLTAIWNAVPEDSRFFVMGGDMNSMVDGNAGNYSLEDEGLTATLLVPADQIANLSCASSVMHGMLANNFTCGVYKMAEGADAAAFADAMKDAIANAQWICGMPEKMVIAVIDGEYVLAAYGINDAIAPFETALGTAYADAEVKYSEAIAG